MSFKCSYCGKEFETPVERARCEIACEAEQKRKAEQERVKKLQENKNKRYNEIQEDVKNVSKKITSYNSDYGESIALNIPNMLDSLRFWL